MDNLNTVLPTVLCFFCFFCYKLHLPPTAMATQPRLWAGPRQFYSSTSLFLSYDLALEYLLARGLALFHGATKPATATSFPDTINPLASRNTIRCMEVHAASLSCCIQMKSSTRGAKEPPHGFPQCALELVAMRDPSCLDFFLPPSVWGFKSQHFSRRGFLVSPGVASLASQ